jgi:hypothetical protein
MNRIIGSIGMVLLFTIIITTTTTAAVSIVLESVSHVQTFQRLPSTGLEVTTTPGANPV